VKPKFFETSKKFRAWLEEYHATESELLVGFFRKDSGKGGITYPEALDEALCYGWIDGIRKNRDESSHTIRFTPRRPTSIWSLVNIAHVRRLTRLGRMKPAGLKLFRERDRKKSQIYSFENREKPLKPKFSKIFKANEKAWKFFRSQPPSYQKVARWWIAWAKREETQLRRLQSLIEASEQGIRLDRFVSRK
jgi:uncharacterized protein YdeI (YjbR/CyaY-like superfamily)